MLSTLCLTTLRSHPAPKPRVGHLINCAIPAPLFRYYSKHIVCITLFHSPENGLRWVIIFSSILQFWKQRCREGGHTQVPRARKGQDWNWNQGSLTPWSLLVIPMIWIIALWLVMKINCSPILWWIQSVQQIAFSAL